MANQYCPECGFELPATARFCMDCGASLESDLTPAGAGAEAKRGRQVAAQQPAPAAAQQPPSKGLDWTAIAAAVVAFFGLRHLSRGARNTVVLLAFLFLFFGCPLICGFVMFAMEWLARLFGF